MTKWGKTNPPPAAAGRGSIPAEADQRDCSAVATGANPGAEFSRTVTGP